VIQRSTNGGYAVAVNEGCRAAAPSDVIVLNPDVVVPPNALGPLANYLRDHPAVGIAAPLLQYPNGTIQESVRTWPTPVTMLARRSPIGRTRFGKRLLARHHLRDRQIDASQPVDNVLGAAMAVRRTAIDSVGGMDERIFLYGEDWDWCYRMWTHGWEVHVVPAAVVEHRYERLSRKTLDFRSSPTRHHWASAIKLLLIHPGLLVGRGARNSPSGRRRGSR
jgi:GT2 family glycosyltransferase